MKPSRLEAKDQPWLLDPETGAALYTLDWLRERLAEARAAQATAVGG